MIIVTKLLIPSTDGYFEIKRYTDFISTENQSVSLQYGKQGLESVAIFHTDLTNYLYIHNYYHVSDFQKRFNNQMEVSNFLHFSNKITKKLLELQTYCGAK